MENVSSEMILTELAKTNYLLSQINVCLLFIIGVVTASVVCYILWRAIKKFI